MRSQPPTAALAAAGLIGGYAVAVAAGSRPLGGLVLLAFGGACIGLWVRRHGWRTAGFLTALGLAAFALSHVIGLLIGGWPAVLLTAAVTAAAYWKLSDSRRCGPRTARTSGARSPSAEPPRA
jgi:hypothetical protein